jgi:hypothetical protein
MKKPRKVAPTITLEHAKSGGSKGVKSARIADALSAIFKAPPDTVHVDRPGARVVRGRRY